MIHLQALRENQRGANSGVERHGKTEGTVLRGLSDEPERQTGRGAKRRCGDEGTQAVDRRGVGKPQRLVPNA